MRDKGVRFMMKSHEWEYETTHWSVNRLVPTTNYVVTATIQHVRCKSCGLIAAHDIRNKDKIIQGSNDSQYRLLDREEQDCEVMFIRQAVTVVMSE